MVITQVHNHNQDNLEVQVAAAVHLAVSNQEEVLQEIQQLAVQLMETAVVTDTMDGPEVAAEVPVAAVQIQAADRAPVLAVQAVQVLIQVVQ